MTAPRILPEHWQWVRFGDVVREVRETTRNPSADGFRRVVGLDHVDPDDLNLTRWDDLSAMLDGTSFTRIFRAGQVLFGKRRAYQRKVAAASFDGICSGDILVFEPASVALLPEFLPYIVQSDGFFEHALGTSAGSLSPRTKWQDLARYEFALPPLREQRGIVEILTSVDEQVHSLVSTISACAEATDALIADRLIENESWPRKTLRSVLERAFAGSWGADPGTDGIDLPVIRSTEFTNDGVPEVTNPAVRAFTAAEVDRLALKPGDVLIEKSGGTEDRPVGRAIEWLNDSPAIASNFVHVLRPDKSAVVPGVLAAALWQLHRRGGTLPLQTATTNMRNLRMRDYLDLPLPVPPIAEAERLGEAVRSVKATWSAAQSHLRRTRLLRRTLLTKLLGGHDAE